MPKFKKYFVQNTKGDLIERNRQKTTVFSVDDVRNMIGQRLYTLDLASIYMGIPVRTLREMIHNGEIVPVQRESNGKSRRLYYLDVIDMDKYIERHKSVRAIA